LSRVAVGACLVGFPCWKFTHPRAMMQQLRALITRSGGEKSKRCRTGRHRRAGQSCRHRWL